MNIRFSAADVTDAEWRALKNNVREFLGTRGSQRVGWHEAYFLALVNDMGGAPAHGKTLFWEEVLRRYKTTRAAEASPLNSWKAARNKYKRLAERIDLEALTTPVPASGLSDQRRRLAGTRQLNARRSRGVRR